MALFEIDESSGLPVWVQLRNRFVYLIKTGHYQPGDQLPSVRTLAAEAQAEREKNARMVLAEVEKDISSMLVDAANVYDENELAVRLRTMHLLYESVKNSGGTVVIPSAYSEGFADAGLDRAPDSLKSGK